MMRGVVKPVHTASMSTYFSTVMMLKELMKEELLPSLTPPVEVVELMMRVVLIASFVVVV